MNKNIALKWGTVIMWGCLILLSAAGLLKTVYVGADIDESYAVTMAIRLIKGDRLFADMWELHQTSAVLYAPFVWLFEKCNGTTGGLLVFLRWIGVCIQGGLAFFVYKSFRHISTRNIAFILAILFFNMTPKQVQSPEYTVMAYWGMMIVSMALLQFYIKKKSGYLVFGAVGLCMLILAYPTAVVLIIPYVLLVFWIEKDNWKKNISIFTGTCVGLGILFLLYVLSGISIKELLKSVSYILMDESHKQSLRELLLIHLRYFVDMLKVTVPIIALCHIGRIIYRKNKNKDTLFFGAVLLILQMVYAFIQFHTIEKVNFLIVLPIILQTFVIGIYFYFAFKRSKVDQFLFWATMVPNMLFVFIILLSSNLTANYSMSFLIPGTLTAVYMIARVFFKNDIKLAKKVVLFGFIACFCGMLITTRVFLVRYTSTQRVNIFVPYYKVTQGVLDKIRVGDLDYRQYETKMNSLKKYVGKDDVFLYVGADMFLYSETAAKIGTGNTISTPAFGEQLFTYYKKHPDRIPTVIFLDCEYIMDYRIWLEEKEFGSFINENYGEPIEEGPLYIYQKLE